MTVENLYRIITENFEGLEINGLKWSNPCITLEHTGHSIAINMQGSELNEELD